MRHAMRTALFAAFLSGCTATKASYHLVDAELTINRARIYGADEHAIYEYTMALRYLEKAREENGYADYKVASELAITASQWADQAVISMDKRGLKKDSQSGDTVTAPGTNASTAPKPGYSVPKPGGN